MNDRRSAKQLVEAYEEGTVSPVDVAIAALECAEESDRGPRPLGAFVDLRREPVLELAEQSAERWKSGSPLGPLDGVPVAIKDEFDMVGFHTRAGTRFLGKEPATEDSTVVARLRAAGAVLFGKTSMTEIGLGGTGMNPASKTPRNPWDLDRLTGGSSSGSAAAVAAGIVPVALGSDAGGSIRMPAAICGVYGLKPTYGRIPTAGGALLSWTLDHLGPLGGTLDDVERFYHAVVGPCSDEAESQFQPLPEPPTSHTPNIAELRFAWCPAFADDADEDVRECFHASLDALRSAGATVEAVSIDEVESIQRVGYLTISAEGAASQRDSLREHRAEYNLDTRLVIAVAERFSAVDYLHAQRIREVIRRSFGSILARFDALLHPTLACTAPPIPKAAFGDGVVDTALNSKVSRYTFAGTLTGLPGLSVPCGAPAGLPVGLHLTTPAWSENRLFEIARAVDQEIPDIGVPEGCFDLLK